MGANTFGERQLVRTRPDPVRAAGERPGHRSDMNVRWPRRPGRPANSSSGRAGDGSRPTTTANRIELPGTPHWLSWASASGSTRSSPSPADLTRAEVLTHASAAPADEMVVRDTVRASRKKPVRQVFRSPARHRFRPRSGRTTGSGPARGLFADRDQLLPGRRTPNEWVAAAQSDPESTSRACCSGGSPGPRAVVVLLGATG